MFEQIKQAHLYVDSCVWPANDVVNTQMTCNRKKVPHPFCKVSVGPYNVLLNVAESNSRPIQPSTECGNI